MSCTQQASVNKQYEQSYFIDDWSNIRQNTGNQRPNTSRSIFDGLEENIKHGYVWKAYKLHLMKEATIQCSKKMKSVYIFIYIHRCTHMPPSCNWTRHESMLVKLERSETYSVCVCVCARACVCACVCVRARVYLWISRIFCSWLNKTFTTSSSNV